MKAMLTDKNAAVSIHLEYALAALYEARTVLFDDPARDRVIVEISERVAKLRRELQQETT